MFDMCVCYVCTYRRRHRPRRHRPRLHRPFVAIFAQNEPPVEVRSFRASDLRQLSSAMTELVWSSETPSKKKEKVPKEDVDDAEIPSRAKSEFVFSMRVANKEEERESLQRSR